MIGESSLVQSRAYRMRWWTLAVLALSLLIIGLDNTILNVAIPTLQREFDASITELQWMVDAYIVVFAGLLLLMGSLGDRFGRKRALQCGLVIFGVTSAFAAYAGSTGELIFARAVLGVGGALIMPSTLSILTNVFPREERGKAIGIWAGVAGLGIGLGPLTGGLLLEHFWWGSVFLVNVPVAALALLAGIWLAPESRDPHPAGTDVPGAALSIAFVSVLVFSIIEAPSRGWADGLILAGFGAGLALAGCFVYWELRTPHPMLKMSFFKNPRFSIGALAIATTFFALFGMIFGMTQYLQFVQGYTPLEAGVRLIPIAIGVVFGAGLSSRLVPRLGANRVVAGGMLALCLVLASISLWQPDTEYWVIGATFFLMAFSMGNVMAPSTDSVMGAVPETNAGVASAMNDVTRQVAGAFGVAVIGSVINTAYRSSMADAASGLPAAMAELVTDSVGATARIATGIPPEIALQLMVAANSAFTDALGTAVIVSAAAALIGAAIIIRFLPPHHLPRVDEPDPGSTSAARPRSRSEARGGR